MIDLHAHLNFHDAFPDWEEALQRAKEAGVRRIVLVGTDAATSRKALEMAKREEELHAVCGIHPHEAKRAQPDLEAIATLCADSDVIAIGETGLDFFRNQSPKEAQLEVFLWHKSLASRLKKPLMIHCRDAYAELAPLLRSCFSFVMHCFAGDQQTARVFLDLGGYLSFAGPITYKKNDHLRETVKYCPLDRLFIETDCPYLPPQPQRGKRNEPAFILHTAELICSLKKVPLEKLSEQLEQNFKALFGKKA